MILEETYTLANGVKIPKVAFGTWQITGDNVIQAVQDAIEVGYRFIDTAQSYGNEAEVAEGVRKSGISRDEMFIGSKVDASLKTYGSVAKSIEGSLKKMGLDYLDQMIIHSPEPWNDFRNPENHYYEGNREAWRALEDACRAGKIRVIGVSNFEIDDLKNIQDSCTIQPMVNQILCHIGHVQKSVLDYCRESIIQVEGYSPIAHGQAKNLQDVNTIAQKYGVSVPQLCICYLVQLGVVPIPKASSMEHIRANADIDFEISAEDMAVLDAVPPLDNYGEQNYYAPYAKANL